MIVHRKVASSIEKSPEVDLDTDYFGTSLSSTRREISASYRVPSAMAASDNDFSGHKTHQKTPAKGIRVPEGFDPSLRDIQVRRR